MCGLGFPSPSGRGGGGWVDACAHICGRGVGGEDGGEVFIDAAW